MSHQKNNMIGEANILVTMTAEDAELFVKFRQFQSAFMKLEQHDALDIKNGSVTMHFDKFGGMKAVQVVRNYY